jgi:hypothetical protein
VTDCFGQRTSTIRLPLLKSNSIIDGSDDVIGSPSKRLKSQVVAQSSADVGKVVNALHLDGFQLVFVSDTRVQKEVGCLERPA